MCKDSSKVRSAVHICFLKCRNVDIAAVKQRLQLFKRNCTIDIRCHCLFSDFHLLCRTWADENNLGCWIKFFYAFSDHCHRRKCRRYIWQHIREVFFYICNKCRATGACQHPLLPQFFRFLPGCHICAKCYFHDFIEPECFDSAYNLSTFGIDKLSGDCRCHSRIYFVILPMVAVFEQIDHLQYIRFLIDGAKWALIYTRATGDTFVVINLCRLVFVHRDCADLTSLLAWALEIRNSTVRTCLRASTTLFTLGFIDMCFLMFVNRDSTEFAGICTAVCQTSAAMLSNFVTANRALITGNLHNLDDILIRRISTHRHLDLLSNDCTFFEYAASHRRFLARDNLHRNIQDALKQSSIPCHVCNLTQHFISKILGSGVKFSHFLFRAILLFLLVLCPILKHI